MRTSPATHRRSRAPLGAATALLVFGVSCLSTSVVHEPPPLTRPVVDRVSRESVEIRWPEDFSNGHPVSVYAGKSPDAIDRGAALAVTQESEVELTRSDEMPYLDDRHRLYYELDRGPGASPVLTAERRLPLDGPDNFRDLGGYETVDGRTVRWGQLYRSNELAGLTKDDLRYLSALDVNLVCDFRSDRERERKPNADLASTEAESLHLSVEQDGADPTTVQHKIRTGGITALGAREIMLTAYRSFVTDHSETWSAMFERIARRKNLPTVVHCTAGKDRTGFASAIVLLALGVPEETVFEDYLATNEYRQEFFRFVLRWIPLYSLFRTDPESLVPLISARREYLEAAIEEMNAGYGSVSAYLENALGVTGELAESLRANLLD